MKQSRTTSLLKSIVSTAVGFGVAFVANMLILPWFGYTPSVSENLVLTTIYTVISIARGYVLERAFEALGWRQSIVSEGEKFDRNRRRPAVIATTINVRSRRLNQTNLAHNKTPSVHGGSST